jgi:hypothetical protein
MATKYSKHVGARGMLTDPLFWGPLAATGVGVALGAGQNVVERIQASRAKARGYKEMLDLHPHLRKHRNQDQVRRIYQSLHNINPTLAKDPTVAGAWVDNVVEQNRAFGDQSNQALLSAVKEMAGIRQDMVSAESGVRKLRILDVGQAGQRAAEQMLQSYGNIMKEHGESAALRKRFGEASAQTKQDIAGMQQQFAQQRGALVQENRILQQHAKMVEAQNQIFAQDKSRLERQLRRHEKRSSYQTSSGRRLLAAVR